MLKYYIPYNLDSPERTIFHKKLIQKKLFLRRLYEEWYTFFIRVKEDLPQGKLIELGSGGGFLKEIDRNVICTDILDLPTNDLTFSALDMPFKNEEVSAIFMIDTFHHVPDSELFLKEAERVLMTNGVLIMVEPANSLWGRFIYKNFHHEPFEVGGDWKIPENGPLSGANGALPWIVFERDKERFDTLFPCLTVIDMKYHTPLRYLVSGGVSFRQLVPDFSYPFFKSLDKILSGISKNLSMFVTIKLQKR
ncbi:class I SAM-dependent methyltransferase [Maribellus mangrovi]|uniref:class I SAM-dependent methyltransferase n=1 Tax=Maribellus mangrovi TaxID=3133146 RepID=UPI0030EEF072